MKHFVNGNLVNIHLFSCLYDGDCAFIPKYIRLQLVCMCHQTIYVIF